MHLHTLTILLLLTALTSGYARFTTIAPQGSTLLNAVFIGSTIGVIICLTRIASRQMEHIGRSVMKRSDLREHDARSP